MVHRALVGNHGMDNETSDLKTKKQKITFFGYFRQEIVLNLPGFFH